MAFAEEWDKCYADNAQMSIWPWSDLVSLVMRHGRPFSPATRILEIGCGAGANIPFFLSLGVDYYAVEGSPFVVARLQEKYPELSSKIAAADFTVNIPFAGKFDLVIDRSSMTHNDTISIQRGLGRLYDLLVPQGKYIGVDWFSTEHSEFSMGIECGDGFTKSSFSEGQFKGVGQVHFSDRQHLCELFEGFTMIVMEHKKVYRYLGEQDMSLFAAWNFVAEKRCAL